MQLELKWVTFRAHRKKSACKNQQVEEKCERIRGISEEH